MQSRVASSFEPLILKPNQNEFKHFGRFISEIENKYDLNKHAVAKVSILRHYSSLSSANFSARKNRSYF